MSEPATRKSWHKHLYQVFPLVRFDWPAQASISYFSPYFKLLLRWASKKTKRDNFYYPLTPKNSGDLAASLGLVFGEPPEIFEGFLTDFRRIKGSSLI